MMVLVTLVLPESENHRVTTSEGNDPRHTDEEKCHDTHATAPFPVLYGNHNQPSMPVLLRYNAKKMSTSFWMVRS